MKKAAIVFGLAIVVASLGEVSQAQASGDAAAGKQKAATCAACHGADGNSAAPTFPKLAGQGAKYLLKQMKDIRDGARPVPTMVTVSLFLSPFFSLSSLTLSCPTPLSIFLPVYPFPT